MRKNDENKNNKPNISVQSQKTKKFVRLLPSIIKLCILFIINFRQEISINLCYLKSVLDVSRQAASCIIWYFSFYKQKKCSTLDTVTILS